MNLLIYMFDFLDDGHKTNNFGYESELDFIFNGMQKVHMGTIIDRVRSGGRVNGKTELHKR